MGAMGYPDDLPDDGVKIEDQFFPEDMDVAVFRHLRYSKVELHTHSFIEILYVHSGRCVNHFSRGSITLESGTFCILPPGVEHYPEVCTDDSVVFNILVRSSTFKSAFFDLLTGDDILSRMFLNIVYGIRKSTVPLFKTGSDMRLRGFVEEMHKESVPGKQDNRRILVNYLRLLFAYLLRDYENGAVILDLSNIHVQDNMVPILRYIQENYATATLTGTAAKYNFSDAYFSRLLKKATGRTFTEIIQELRLQRATELLRNSAVTIEQIVEDVGYSEASHFYKLFKSAYGMTPAEYRESLGGR